MIYRNLNSGRFRLYPLRYRFSDAQLGVCGLVLSEEALRGKVMDCLAQSYAQLDKEIAHNPDFATSLSPLPGPFLTATGQDMAAAARRCKVGPMAAVAGALAERICSEMSEFCTELFCENGGDIALLNRDMFTLSVFPGGPPFDRPLLLKIPPGKWGIASSSGEFGHSYSRGEAQLVTVIAENAALADAAATAIANEIRPGCAPQEIVEQPRPGIFGCMIIWQNTLAYKGEFDLDISASG